MENDNQLVKDKKEEALKKLIELINKLKSDSSELQKFFATSSSREIVKVLNKFGRIGKDFASVPLFSLMTNKHDKIRALAVKTIAKLKDITLIDKLVSIIQNDTSSDVQREAVSAIGRMRNFTTESVLTNLLDHHNPEVVLQAIRGLLVLRSVIKRSKDDTLLETAQRIQTKLSSLITHPNEIVRQVISSEFGEKKSKEIKAHENARNQIIHGDSRIILKGLPEESIHLTFTSPPYYNARDYSIYSSYEEYLGFLSDVFQEIHRMTIEGRFLVVNTSPIIIPRAGRKYSSNRYPIPFDIHHSLTKMGWEFIDDIIWLKPEASVKNRNGGFQQHRKPLAYKPNTRTEYVMVYRKKTTKLIDWNLKQYSDEIIEESKIKDNNHYETSNVWEIDPTFDKIHTAVFPLKLCHEVIKLYSLVGDVICDPFAGSGTIGIASKELGRYYTLVESNAIYFNSIKNKLDNDN